MKTDLLKFTEKGGCSSKIDPGQLEDVLRHLPLINDPNILVNIDTHDDAGVYRLNDDLLLVFTVDFFPPVCSDPYEFGQIAAANAISDIYAMGAEPLLALNIMMFPSSILHPETYSEIIRGGFEKASEAGVRIIGGHTIDDSVPKYGLAVIGFVKPGDLVTNAGALPGDRLILTKALGSGIILAGHRLGMTGDEDLTAALSQMKLLNKSGAEIMKRYRAGGATDITGFGLAGHALKMAKASNVTIMIEMKKAAVIGNALRLAGEGCLPGACFRNLEYAENDLQISGEKDYNLKMLAFDAQTSGGLLISVKKEDAGKMLGELKRNGMPEASIIGEVSGRGEKALKLVC